MQMQSQTTSVRALLASPLPFASLPAALVLVALVMAALVLAAPARAQDGSGGCSVVSEDNSTGQTEVSCPSVDADIEKHGSTSLREANATLLASSEDLIAGDEDVMLGLTAISKPSRVALSADEVSFLYASGNSGGSGSEKLEGPGIEQDGVIKRVSRGKNDEGERTVSTMYLIGLSDDSLRRIANSETFRLKVGQAVFDFSETPMSAQAEAVLEAR